MGFAKTFIRGALLASVAIPSGAMAQAADEADQAQAAPAYGAGEIVVTAQRRSERLQDIPATISALDGEALAKAGVADITNIAPRVPAFMLVVSAPAVPSFIFAASAPVSSIRVANPRSAYSSMKAISGARAPFWARSRT